MLSSPIMPKIMPKIMPASSTQAYAPTATYYTKLKYYEITGSTYNNNWIQTGLTYHSQCIVLNSESLSFIPALSGGMSKHSTWSTDVSII